MIIRRLQWAGVYIETSATRLLIDPVYKSPNTTFFGEPKQEFKPIDIFGKVDIILVTHLHSDHFDPIAIIEAFGPNITVLAPAGSVDVIENYGFINVKGMEVGDQFIKEELEIFATYSVDGLGDEQIAWVIKTPTKTAIHCGDTLWHGYWWNISSEYGPFDVAFLPSNGAIIEEQGIEKSNQPICMTPEQAVSAAKILGTELLIPIHYGSFHNPPFYNETENVVQRIQTASDNSNISLKLLKHFEEVIL